MNEMTAIFESHRSRLIGIAYRMLGSLVEAQDVVQETYLRWHNTDRAAINNEGAWLTTVCARLALNQLNSARVERERYVGDWLPEPFPPSLQTPTEERLELDETISCALLVTLERLSPNERAAYLLHDVFDYSFDQIAEILALSVENCRQLASRARRRIRTERPRFDAGVDEHQRLIDAFMRATQEGDMSTLLNVLAPEAVLRSDGGGKASTIAKPLRGAEKIARFFLRVWNDRGQDDPPLPQGAWLNGAPGIVVYEGKVIVAALSLEVQASRITTIYAMRNPEKLANLQP